MTRTYLDIETPSRFVRKQPMPPKRTPPARPPTTRSAQRGGAHPSTDGSPTRATSPTGDNGTRTPHASAPHAANPLAPSVATSINTAELVSALTTALRTAFPEAIPRRHRRAPAYEPLPPATSDDEEVPLTRGFETSQSHPGRYHAHLTESDSEDSDTDYSRPLEHSRRHPTHIRPHREPTGARGQRLFTVTDPPTRRDFRNALLFVDRASRSSKYFGTRDVVEVQLLEEFLHVWDSTPPLKPSAKLRIFDRVRLLYHPFRATRTPPPPSSLERPSPLRRSQIVPADPPPEDEVAPRLPEEEVVADLPSRPLPQNPPSDLFGPLVRTCVPPPTELFDRMPLWHHRDYVPLPPSDTPPPTDVPVSLPPSEATPSSAALAQRVVTELDIVLKDPQPILVGVGDQQVIAIVQDIVQPPDILLQAIQAANLPCTPTATPAHSEPLSTSSTEDEEEEDTWVLAADRILRWLDNQPVADEPDSQGDDTLDDDDSRAPTLLHPGPWHPVRPSAPPPQVDWDSTSRIFSFHPPASYGNLRVACDTSSVVNNRPPDPEQLPVLREAVASMEASGLIARTTRGPFLSPIQLAPKNSRESRFVLDASHLTPHLKAPPFRLDPLPKVLLQVPLPPQPYFVKVDLAEAFYHVTLHPQARRLTTFRLDGKYYHFTRMPFGLRPAPFVMQSLATAFSRHLRSKGLWAWSYVDNILAAHSDSAFLQRTILDFVDDLTTCGFKINPRDTCLTPATSIKFLGFCLDTNSSTLSHTPQRVQSLRDTLRLLETPQPQKLYRRLAGLGPVYCAKCGTASLMWSLLCQPPPSSTMYADASATGLAVVTTDAAFAVITNPSPAIYLRETIAWLPEKGS
ncbi:hypothetical protein HPB47_014777 [Ixodes persulcatus]|uniref:Uncharacterized protein n=1 Tax=Ixodes persulcatus TaxID=34615 RepID=A0AC60QVE7_IXOPE|nr:hypothetical protein HPB47_014777 [Ixodes persulcatus]